MKIKYVILGLGALLTALITTGFLYLQFFLHSQSIVTSEQKKEHHISNTVQSTIFIEKMNDYALKGFHIEARQSLTKELKGMEARDKNGSKMPLNQLKAGQIVTIENNVITLVPSVHMINDLTGVQINLEKMSAQVGHTTYRLADAILAVDTMGKRLSLTDLSPYDVVSFTLYQDKVWSIIREKAASRLILTNVPKQTGQIAVDNSRLIQLKDTKGGIPITPGPHKIVVKVPGYIPLSTSIIVEDGKDYTLSLSDIKRAYTTIKPQLNVNHYSLTINQQTYSPQDNIKIPQGHYTVTIQSPGYKSWQGQIELSKDIYLLRVNLIKLGEESDEEEAESVIYDDEETTDFLEDELDVDETEEEQSTSNNTSNTASSSSLSTASNDSSNNSQGAASNNASSSLQSTSSNNASSNASDTSSSDAFDSASSTSNTARTITLTTSPSGATIYKGDTLIGTSPFTTQLEDGIHEFTLQKEDYMPYQAKVTLDQTDEGGIYLYKLKKTEKTE